MKAAAANRIRLGMFVSIALGMFIIVIYFIGDARHMFSKTIEINGTFKDLDGLQVGNNVRFTGLNIGTISKVEIATDSTVRVDMIIEKSVQKFIRVDATASIGSEGLMGNKVINILAGNPDQPTIKDGATVQTVTPVSMDDIMKNMAVTTVNAAHITGDIAILTTNIKEGHGAIGKLFMDSLFAESLRKTMVNAQHATGNLNEDIKAAQNNILLRGYFKKKEAAAAKAHKDSLKGK